MPFIAYYYKEGEQLRQLHSKEEVQKALESGKGLLWVDVRDTTLEDGEFLKEVFGFHNRAVDSCVSELIHPPDVQEFADYLFITFHGIDYGATGKLVRTKELAVFLAHNYVVTNHNFHMYSADYVEAKVLPGGGPMQKGPNSLVNALLDALTYNILKQVDALYIAAGEIELEVMEHPGRSAVRAIQLLRRSVMHLQRVMVPQRQLVDRLSRPGGPSIIDVEEARVSYRDILQRVMLIEIRTLEVRDLADSAMDTVNIRQEETMKTLTIWATILLPLTLLVGLYGMNVGLPMKDSSWGFWVLMGIMGIYTATALVWLNRQARGE
ncbi:MAG: magnesium transporter CorA family protein [Candidatus Bathyarchaeia archaeon]